MKRNATPIIVLLIIVLIIGMWIFINSDNNKQMENTPVFTEQAEDNINNNAQLFSDSSFAQYAYLISTPTYDAKTDKALSGFKVTKNDLADGSTEYVLSSQNKEYVTQKYVIKSGEKLYFIESNLDDDVNNEDKFLGDDTAVVVDANGYIVTK